MVFILYFCVNYFLITVSHSKQYNDKLSCHVTTNVGNNSEANPDDTLMLNCSSTNGNIEKFQWRKDGKLLNTSAPIFTKSNISRYDAGQYECILVQRNQTKGNCSAFIKVNSAPQITGISMIPSEGKDEALEITCYANGYPQPNFTWDIKNGTLNLIVGSTGKINAQNYFSKVRKDYAQDGEVYICKVENKFGKTNRTKHYTRDEMCPSFKFPGNTIVTVKIGKPFTLLCQMKHPKQNHRSYDILPRFVDENHIYQTSHDLKNYTVLHAAKNDTGLYNCSYNVTQEELKKCIPLNKSFHVIVIEPTMVVKTTNHYIAIAISLAGALIGFVFIILAYYLHKNKLKSHRFYDSVPELRWDVFVSYSSKDFTWVKELCETLEQPPFNLIVCLHQRDWELGRTVIDNMADSVYCSYKTLLIVSKNYLESTYCMQELKLAVTCESGTRNDHRDKILLIKIDDTSLKRLPKYLRQKSYLDFSNSDERKHFNEKLLKALPRRESIDMGPADDNGNSESTEVKGNDVELDEITATTP